MTAFISELIGTGMLIILGQGVVANVVLPRSKGLNGGWVVISFGWAIGVFVGVYCAAASKAHLNPAVTLAFAFLGKFPWELVPQYIAAQLLGAMAGSLLAWLAYRGHYSQPGGDPDAKLATFCTGPAIRQPLNNLVTEIIGTFVLIFGVLYIAKPTSTLGALDALPVALLVLGIGLSLGGPTGYAINPARDLGPRIMHTLLPIPGKRDSDWSYAWVPILGPVLGAFLAAMIFKLL